MKAILIAIIKLYQHTLSPDHGWFRGAHPYGYCRYHPTCSEYASQAINRHGALRGAGMAMLRVLRCHPWAKGGNDPVPMKTISK